MCSLLLITFEKQEYNYEEEIQSGINNIKISVPNANNLQNMHINKYKTHRPRRRILLKSNKTTNLLTEVKKRQPLVTKFFKTKSYYQYTTSNPLIMGVDKKSSGITTNSELLKSKKHNKSQFYKKKQLSFHNTSNKAIILHKTNTTLRHYRTRQHKTFADLVKSQYS